MSLAFPSAGEEVREQLHAEVSGRRFPDAAQRALDIGTEYLGTGVGLVARTDPEADRWEVVASTDSDGGRFPPGRTVELSETYCRWAVEHDRPVALHDAPGLGWEEDPALDQFELHCYHGAPIQTGDGTYGAICFLSEQSRPAPFRTEETAFVELAARLLGEALDRESE